MVLFAHSSKSRRVISPEDLWATTTTKVKIVSTHTLFKDALRRPEAEEEFDRSFYQCH